MKIPVILTSSIFTATLANLPDPNVPQPDRADYVITDDLKLTEKSILDNSTDFETATGSKGVTNIGDMVITLEQNATIFGEKDFGPGGRSFKRPKRIWDQYPKNGRFRIAVKVDRDSFDHLRELTNFDTVYPEAVQDFLDKTGIELGYHKDYNYHGNPNRNDPEWDHAHWLMLTANSNQGLGGCSSWMGRMGNWRLAVLTHLVLDAMTVAGGLSVPQIIKKTLWVLYDGKGVAPTYKAPIKMGDANLPKVLKPLVMEVARLFAEVNYVPVDRADGSKELLTIGTAMRDPAQFGANSEDFDLTRGTDLNGPVGMPWANLANVGGSTSRGCPAMHLSIELIEAFVGVYAAQAEQWEFDGEFQNDKVGAVLRRKA